MDSLLLRKTSNRRTFRFRLAKSCLRAVPSLWGFLGATLSHQLALNQAALSEAPHCLIFEDDALPCLNGQPFHKILREALHAVPFLLLQFGARAAGCAPRSKRRTVRTLSGGFKLCLAERCYQAHSFLVSNRAIPLLLQLLQNGASPDGALVSLQAKEARQNRRTCFFLQPAVITQLDTNSDTCRGAPSWKVALAKKKTNRKRNYTAAEILGLCL